MAAFVGPAVAAVLAAAGTKGVDRVERIFQIAPAEFGVAAPDRVKVRR